MIDLIQLRKEAKDAYDWDEHRDVSVPAKDVLALLDVVEAAKDAMAQIRDQRTVWPGEVDTLGDALARLDGKEQG